MIEKEGWERWIVATVLLNQLRVPLLAVAVSTSDQWPSILLVVFTVAMHDQLQAQRFVTATRIATSAIERWMGAMGSSVLGDIVEEVRKLGEDKDEDEEARGTVRQGLGGEGRRPPQGKGGGRRQIAMERRERSMVGRSKQLQPNLHSPEGCE